MKNYLSRRETLAKASAAGLGAAALLLTSQSGQAQPTTTAATPPITVPAGDLDVVRFALTMEQLEAAFYAQVVSAHQSRAYLSPRAFELTQQIAAAEASHVAALQAVLTSAGQAVPAAPDFQFPAGVFVSPISFAWLAYTLEEIGIGAYLGAVGQIESDEIRAAAASIYGAEAQHAAILRTFASFDFAPKYYETPLSTEQVTQLIAPYIVA